jgi:hypothetical protein
MANKKINKNYFLLLVDKYLEGKCSEDEKKYIINFYESFQNDKDIFEDSETSEEEVRIKILNQIKEDLNHNSSKTHKINNSNKEFKVIFRRNVFKYVASFIIIFGIGYIIQQNILSEETVTKDIIVETNSVPDKSKDITLSLANGNIEVISENGDRKVYDVNGKIVGVQKGNQLNYTQKKDKTLEKLVYNELTIPYGKRFDLVLSDGTKVKLNSGTSIKYPVQFIEGENRQVFINGEAYFDVVKDKNHPFIVNANNINVEVLGTEFNMSFYPEDKDISTVLVEGSVELYENRNDNKEIKPIKLSPGYKAAWSKNKEAMSVNKVDVSIYTAWKDGNLLFKNASFENIIKKLERKFNVIIDNKYNFLDQQIYTASFLDNESIEDILEYFSEETSFNYTKENNKITIITNLTN